MARVRKIKRLPTPGRNYFLVDANFLANKFIPPLLAPAGLERTRIESCLEWWREIDDQVSGRASFSAAPTAPCHRESPLSTGLRMRRSAGTERTYGSL
jgi:hypothetical protein